MSPLQLSKRMYCFNLNLKIYLDNIIFMMTNSTVTHISQNPEHVLGMLGKAKQGRRGREACEHCSHVFSAQDVDHHGMDDDMASKHIHSFVVRMMWHQWWREGREGGREGEYKPRPG